MVLLPDYPQKTIQAHGTRVERLTLTCTLLLIAAGGWWLTRTVEVESDALSTYGPVVILFTSALMLRDLIFFGPKERSRLTAAANISWPSILAFAGVTYGPNDQAIAFLLSDDQPLETDEGIPRSLGSTWLQGHHAIAICHFLLDEGVQLNL